MGFLIFAFRKASLKMSINRHEAQLMQVSRQLQATQEQASIMQQTQDNVKSAWMSMAYASQNQNGNIFQSTLKTAQDNCTNAQNQYNQVNSNSTSTPEQKAEAKKALDDAQKQAEQAKATAFLSMQSNMFGGMNQQMAMNSIFNANDKAQYARLEQEDRTLTQRKAHIESQLSLENAELQSVEKGEEDAAKKSAPKFGQG